MINQFGIRDAVSNTWQAFQICTPGVTRSAAPVTTPILAPFLGFALVTVVRKCSQRVRWGFTTLTRWKLQRIHALGFFHLVVSCPGLVFIC